jgi:hypothetical protein
MLSWCGVLNVTCSDCCLVVNAYAKGEVHVGVNHAFLTKRKTLNNYFRLLLMIGCVASQLFLAYFQISWLLEENAE